MSDPGQESGMIPAWMPRGRRGKLGRLMRNKPAYTQLLAQLRAGASLSAVAAGVRTTPETMRRWLEQGRIATHGTYKRFYLDCMAAIGAASVVTEAEVRKSNPEFWLRYGPRRYLGDEWRDDPEQHKVIEHTESNKKDSITHDTLVAALKELRASGVDLNQLVDKGVIDADPVDKSDMSVHFDTTNESIPAGLLEKPADPGSHTGG